MHAYILHACARTREAAHRVGGEDGVDLVADINYADALALRLHQEGTDVPAYQREDELDACIHCSATTMTEEQASKQGRSEEGAV